MKIQKSQKNVIIVTAALAVLLGGIFLPLGNMSFDSPAANTSVSNQKVLETDLGNGYINPQVVSAGYDYYIAATVNYGVLTLHMISAADGKIVDSANVAWDVDRAYFRIAYDSKNDEIMVVWINSTQNLNFTYVTDISTGTLNPTNTNRSVVSDECDETFVGLTSNNNGLFYVVYTDVAGYNYLVIIENGNVGSPIPVSEAGPTADNFVAYDDASSKLIVLWQNDTNSNGAYDIDYRMFADDGTPATGILKFAGSEGLDVKVFSFPSAEGGGGVFFVAAGGYSQSNDSYYFIAGIVDRDGTIVKEFYLGPSAQHGMSYPGIAYNGTGFIVTWTNATYDIVARGYDTSGNPTGDTVAIKDSSDAEEWQDVAVIDKADTLYFVWYDFNSKHDYGSLWTGEEFVPEFGVLLPLFAILVVAFVTWRRK